MSNIYYRVGNKKLYLKEGAEFAAGAEGLLYRTGLRHAVKLFKDPDISELAESLTGHNDHENARARLRIMQTKLPDFPPDLPQRVIAPEQCTYRHDDRISGYRMQYVLFSNVLKQYRKEEFREKSGVSNDTIVEIFRDLHRMVSALHVKGIVIGDFNDENILIKGNTAFIIDTDSFQFGRYSCKMFTPEFVDPGVCQKGTQKFQLLRPYTADSDWYAYVVMLFQSLLLTHPFGGKYIPKKREGKIPDTVRSLYGISLFDPRVRYPPDAFHYSVLPDNLLQFFSDAFEQEKHGVFPAYLLDMHWKSCSKCKTVHARPKCPKCTGTTTRKLVTIHGNVTARYVFHTDGRIISAAFQNGQLQYLYKDKGVYRREDGSRVARSSFQGRSEACVVGNNEVLKATEKGIVRVDTLRNRVIRSSPDTSPFVNAESKLFAVPGGVYVINNQDIILLQLA